MSTSSTLDFLQITYRPDLNLLVGRWMRQVTMAELQRGYLAMLAQAEAHQCRFWLIDARRRIDTDSNAGTWLLSEFASQLQPRLGGHTYLAYLLAPVHLRQEQVQGAFPPPRYFQDKPYKAERFTDERTAVQWLQQHEPETAV